jgi:hypothetical protein
MVFGVSLGAGCLLRFPEHLLYFIAGWGGGGWEGEGDHSVAGRFCQICSATHSTVPPLVFLHIYIDCVLDIRYHQLAVICTA